MIKPENYEHVDSVHFIKLYRISSNKHPTSNKRLSLIIAPRPNKHRTSKCDAYWSSYHILVVATPKYICNYNPGQSI